MRGSVENANYSYHPGVGTPGTLPGSSFNPTQQSIDTATDAYKAYAAAAFEWRKTNPDGDLTAMVSLGIGTGFERSYHVLKRLAVTPLGRPRLVAAKIAEAALRITASTSPTISGSSALVGSSIITMSDCSERALAISTSC